MPDPTPHPDAIAKWQERLEFLLEKEAQLSDPAQQFTVHQQIQEAEERIRELSIAPLPSPPPRDPESERHNRRLKELYRRKKELTLAGDDTTAVLEEIKDVRRLIHRGPILHPGDLLAEGRFELHEAAGQGGFGYVPGGTFRMGSPKDEVGRSDGEVPHDVTLTHGFWLGETEVTQGQWKQLMEVNPSDFSACGDDCPVENVSWYEAVTFANRLSAEARLEECYQLHCKGVPGVDGYFCSSADVKEPCYGYRLPTEAEWERAVRAGRDSPIYSSKLTIVGADNGPTLDRIAWYAGNSEVEYGGYYCSDWKEKPAKANRCGTHPVGQKNSNEWGMYDILGNVFEWCADAYSEHPTEARADPFVRNGSFRVYRGGSWDSVAHEVRAAYRNRRGPSLRWNRLGFRLALGQRAPGRSPGK